tara:strand:+ start:172 stop:1104 length:933 start_codon:yes stop_codon:yes gene_type:complete
MNIIITGALGHIGTYLLFNSHKLKKIKKIYAIDKIDEKMLVLLNLTLKKKVFFINQDLSKKKINLKNENIDFVIHLASTTNAAASLNNKKDVYKNNLSCFKNVINFCKKKKAKLIHISSTSVYGSQELYVDEECKELKPQSPYAEVKIKEEKILKKINTRLKYVSLRFGTIVGPSAGMRFHTAVNKFCMQAYLNEPLHVWRTALNQFRPYLSIRDAFKALSFFLMKKNINNQLYNIVSENLTVKQIIKKIQKHKKIKIKLVNEKIMNQLSYKTKSVKIQKMGLKLDCKLQEDINMTFKLLKKKSFTNGKT